jgi:hypothetical protein
MHEVAGKSPQVQLQVRQQHRLVQGELSIVTLAALPFASAPFQHDRFPSTCFLLDSADNGAVQFLLSRF